MYDNLHKCKKCDEGLNMSGLFPETTEDERDPREDQSDNRTREEEIKGDKPPHHQD
jgi:hypothetical protein